MPRKSAVRQVPAPVEPPSLPSSFHPMPPEGPWRSPAQVSRHSLRQVAEMVQTGQLRIPPFQRSFVWEDDHILHLLDSIARGFYVGNATLWEQYKLPVRPVNIAGIEAEGVGHGFLVVDGQQRIGAIARALLTDRYAYDFKRAQFVVSEGPAKDHVPLHLLFGAERIRVILDGVKDDLWSADQVGWLNDSFLYRDFAMTVLPPAWSIELVMEMFARMNTAGVRMDASEVEAALRKARES